MGEMKPTKGEAFNKRIGFSTVYVEVRIGGGWLQEVAACGPTANGQDEQQANADLITEAFNVHHNTGLSPVRLVEMVKELAKVLSDARNELTHLIHTHNEQNSSDGSWKYDWQTVCEMDAALAKCEGVGNE